MNSNWSYSPKTPNSCEKHCFMCRVTLKFDGWPWKTIAYLFYTTPSFVHNFIKIYDFKLELQSGNNQIRAKCALTPVTLTFDFWPWPFAWTLPLSMVLTPENFMTIQWWEHSEKVVTDRRTDRQTDRDRQTERQTDRRTDWTIHRAAWS